MDNKTYLIRAFAVAGLLWGSVATVVAIAQRPEPQAATPAASQADEVAKAH